MKRAPCLTPFLLSCVAVFCLASDGRAANLFVASTGAGDCSQATPCGLDTALAAAAPGDTLFLAQGTYTGAGDPLAHIASSVTLRGGWNGGTATPPIRSADPSLTVLDGEGARRVAVIDSGLSVTLENLTVTRGFYGGNGGGITASNGDLTLRSVVVSRCVAYLASTSIYGGGLYVNAGSLRVTGSTFSRNAAVCETCATSDGGGIYGYALDRLEIEGSTFDRNDAWHGSGVSATRGGLPLTELDISSSVFSDNGAAGSEHPQLGGYGGGMEAGWADATVSGCTLSGNHAGNQGGAIRFYYGTFHLLNSRILANSAHGVAGVQIGGADYLVQNNIIAENQPGLTVGTAGIEITGVANGTLIHNSIVGTDGAARGAGIKIAGGGTTSHTLRNNILARLDTGLDVSGGAPVGEDYTFYGADTWANGQNLLDPSGTVTQTHSFNGVPGFGDAWRPDSTAAVRDLGGDFGVTRDIDGLPRSSPPDIGAAEYQERVAVGSPNGGERLPSGGAWDIRWGTPDGTESVTLFYSLNDGATWTRIARGLPGSSFRWSVPVTGATRGKCRVKAVAFDGGAVSGSDRSDRRFSIQTVRVISPANGDSLPGGAPAHVVWQTYATARPVASVKLYFSQDSGLTWTPASPPVPAWNPGRAVWNVPIRARTRPNCKLKVVLLDAAGRPLGSSVSGGLFSILH